MRVDSWDQTDAQTCMGHSYTTDNVMHLPILPQGASKIEKKKHVTPIMHEMGHAVALYHEHQRHDASNSVRFNCHNLKGYDDAKIEVAKAGFPDFLPTKNIDERMAQVCSNVVPAANWLPGALDFLPFDEPTPTVYYEQGGDFDFNSIMIYSSYVNAARNGPDDRVLEDIVSNWPVPEVILQGGHWDPDQVKLSDGDIARVVQLYPRTDLHAKKRTTGHWPPLRVEMPGYTTTTVRSAPPERLTSWQQMIDGGGGYAPGQLFNESTSLSKNTLVNQPERRS